MNTFYKLKEFWGMDAVMWVLEYIAEKLQDDYIPNDDCRYWIKKNKTDYLKDYPDFNKYVNDNLTKLLLLLFA